jgi:glycosyltransferase involved in cell wall biosynthesis
VICIDSGPDGGPATSTLASVIEHSPSEARIVVCSAQTDLPALELRGREVIWLEPDPAHTGNDPCGVLAAAEPADVVLLDEGCEVTRGWLERLREAAYYDTANATVSALSIAGPIGSRFGAHGYSDAAQAVAAASLRLHPRIDAPQGPCRYIRRGALELAGPFDGDFAARCLSCGLAHVMADDVLVRVSGDRAGTAALPQTGAPPRKPALARALGAARRALHDLTLTVDARILHGPITGTHVHVLELIGALAGTGAVQVTVLLPRDPSPHARAALASLPQLRLVSEVADLARGARADIVHRPFQISTPADLAVLAPLADRLVITHQDLISYHNPSYFRRPEDWHGYRDLTRTAFAVADHVAFFSAHVREDALAEDLLEPHRGSVVPIGVDHVFTGAQVPVPPRRVLELADGQQAMLYLGTDLRHKNRLFALRILSELHRQGWPGVLLLAGGAAEVGSSRAEEGSFLSQRPELAASVSDLGPVREDEKAWLLDHAALVLYPSVQEGFGLVPFEAAQHGAACLWAPGSSLSEVLPDQAADIVPWDPAASAGRALRLMRDEVAWAANVEAVNAAATTLRWSHTAAALVELYRRTCDGPPSPAGARERAMGVMRDGVSEDAMRLVGPGGLLPPELERPLLALAAHRRIAAPVFTALKVGYAAADRWRRR